MQRVARPAVPPSLRGRGEHGTTSNLSLHSAIYLFIAGTLAGAINAVAGGGSFISFPALLFTGVAPIPANATNTLALWVGTSASGSAYKNRLKLPQRMMVPLVATSILGGLAGAVLLIRTPSQTFLRLLPWLLLGATLLFSFGRHITARIAVNITHDTSNAAIVIAAI